MAATANGADQPLGALGDQTASSSTPEGSGHDREPCPDAPDEKPPSDREETSRKKPWRATIRVVPTDSGRGLRFTGPRGASFPASQVRRPLVDDVFAVA
jgi:hypothetical protein